MCFACLFSACASYRVEGTTNVPTLDGQRLYLKVPHQDAIVDLDSCEVIHGIFRMDGEVDSVTFGAIYIGGESLMPVESNSQSAHNKHTPIQYFNSIFSSEILK